MPLVTVAGRATPGPAGGAGGAGAGRTEAGRGVSVVKLIDPPELRETYSDSKPVL